MASVDDVGPDKELRALARRIDADTRQRMTPTELRLRCEFVFGLLSEAGSGDNPDGKRLRRDAERYLNAVSLSTYLTLAGAITREIDAKQADGDMDAVHRLGDELGALNRKHPQVVFECASSDERAVVTILTELQAAQDGNPAAKGPRFPFWRSK